jgi:hypothetical protein
MEKRSGSNHPGEQGTAKIIDRRIKLAIPQMPGNSNVIDAININLVNAPGAEPEELKAAAQGWSRKEPAGNVTSLCRIHSAQSLFFDYQRDAVNS